MTTQNTAPPEDLYSNDEPQQEKIVTYGIRLPETLKDNFVAHCKAKGTDASKVLKKFMAREIASNKT